MKRITAKRLNELAIDVAIDGPNEFRECLDALTDYLNWKLFGPDEEEWSISQLKKRFGQYAEALNFFKGDNGHYITGDDNYHRKIGLMYPKRPADQVMTFVMRIAQYIPCEIKANGHWAVHKYLKKYHAAFRYFGHEFIKQVRLELNKQ